ncbi:insulinase family protein [Falsigemmobacter intermedius]|uniref:Uncharacterized protein n=1 Tax=Falsigemmobacter intermedius TaxID=1553448 RepID=A0A444M9R3_9RHOB|nr:insulinase family protein [Falsigemmobacter intermedius]RWY39636.1 hypothetical protein EP867_13460 [Falsigemmobacter intermedius]
MPVDDAPLQRAAHPAFDLPAARRTDRGLAQLLRHRATGARLLWVPEPHPEPVFTISFPTRLRDDRGAAHVLEHLIFRGSERYPADPLYPALTEAGMVSFLNASTRPDYTTFHVASPTPAGLTPLVRVLSDLVFNPNLASGAFREEAWDRPEADGPARGVILSEMRDYLSSAEAALALALRSAVLGGGDGAFNQGGDPAELLKLTPDQLRAFHQRAFTPQNAWMTLWGGEAAALEAIDIGLREAREQGVPMPPARPGGPRRLSEIPHASGRRLFGLAWRLPPEIVPELLPLLDSLLLTGPAALLRRMPGLVQGQATALSRDMAHPCLTLAFADAPDPQQIAGLKHLSQEVRSSAVAAALRHALAVWYDEDVTPRRPQGLLVFDPLLAPWLNGGDPFAHLDIGRKLQALLARPEEAHRQVIAAMQKIFRPEGPDSRVALVPERTAAQRPSDPPAGRALPFRPLRLDHPADGIPDRIPVPEIEGAGHAWLVTGDESRLARLCIAFLAGAEGYQPLAAQAAALAQALARHDLLAENARALKVRAGACGGRGVIWLHLSALPEEMLRCIRALPGALAGHGSLAGVDPAPGLRSLMISRPQTVIGLRLRAGLSAEARLEDAHAGPGMLLQPSRGDGPVPLSGPVWLAGTGIALSVLTDLQARLSALSVASYHPPLCLPEPGAGDGFALPVPFHAVGLGFRAADPAAARVLLRAGEAAFLWPEIRGAGGAYGLRCELSSTGEAAIFTARDPHLLRSLDLLRGAVAAIRPSLSADLLQRGRIGAAGQLLTPPGPHEVLTEVLRARISGSAPWGAAQAELSRLQALTSEDLIRSAEDLHEALQTARVVVFGPKDSLMVALKTRPGLFTLHSDL